MVSCSFGEHAATTTRSRCCSSMSLAIRLWPGSEHMNMLLRATTTFLSRDVWLDHLLDVDDVARCCRRNGRRRHRLAACRGFGTAWTPGEVLRSGASWALASRSTGCSVGVGCSSGHQTLTSSGSASASVAVAVPAVGDRAGRLTIASDPPSVQRPCTGQPAATAVCRHAAHAGTCSLRWPPH